ncbi:hypothetical protein B0H11DRAFT_2216055 [Mycena galericulata]|nr:hypothetical protein B0H11DRAFT_2216055 [Mycena galericulata]
MTATSTELCSIPGGVIRQGTTSVVSTICQFSSSPFPLLQKDEFAQEGALGSSVVNLLCDERACAGRIQPSQRVAHRAALPGSPGAGGSPRTPPSSSCRNSLQPAPSPFPPDAVDLVVEGLAHHHG